MCVCVYVCNIPLYIFVFAVYLLVSYMCAKIRVWSCLVTDNFDLFTEIAVCKFLRGWRSYGLKPFLFCPLYVFIKKFAAFCTAHCALDLVCMCVCVYIVIVKYSLYLSGF